MDKTQSCVNKSFLHSTYTFAGIAQLVERHFCKVDVRGSNPRAGSKEKNTLNGCFFSARGFESRRLSSRGGVASFASRRKLVTIPRLPAQEKYPLRDIFLLGTRIRKTDSNTGRKNWGRAKINHNFMCDDSSF